MQTRMWIGNLTFPDMGVHEVSVCHHFVKTYKFSNVFFSFQLLCVGIQPSVFLK